MRETSIRVTTKVQRISLVISTALEDLSSGYFRLLVLKYFLIRFIMTLVCTKRGIFIQINVQNNSTLGN